MIERVTEAAPVNAIANRPDVRQLMFLGTLYPQDPLDFAEWVDNPQNVVLIDDGFCSIFNWSSPGVYECHVMAGKEARGAHAIKAMLGMFVYMKEMGATKIWGQPSIYNRAAICYIRRMGLTSAGFGNHPIVGDVQYFTKDL